MATQKPPVQVSLPGDLDSPRAKLVYLYLSTVGEASVRDLTDHLDIKRMTAYSILSTLSSRGFVTREGETYAAATPRSA
jgi:DNA-binding MarR family transcriptional regulator